MKKAINFGSDIRFTGEHKGTKNHLKYKWVAMATDEYPDSIIICKDDMFWLKIGDKLMIRNLKRILSHEPIHNILWDIGIDGNYDFLLHKFRKQIKKECPKTYRDYLTF